MGLGLSLVAAIVHMHGFTLSLDDAEPGLIVHVTCQRLDMLQ
jgi:signal transduction histidine kinase